jgi:hypothetical protein
MSRLNSFFYKGARNMLHCSCHLMASLARLEDVRSFGSKLEEVGIRKKSSDTSVCCEGVTDQCTQNSLLTQIGAFYLYKV